jgi:hypothetical protein
VTSVEHSGLESRAFSNEVVHNGSGPIRIFCEAEFSQFTKPFEPWFDQPTASNTYAAGILDRDLLYRARLRDGLVGNATQTVLIPRPGRYTLWARMKTRYSEESGRFKVSMNGRSFGEILVKQGNREWKWAKATQPPTHLASGPAKLVVETSDAGILVDQFLMTNTSDWTPPPSGNRPSAKPTIPKDLKTVSQVLASVTLTWQESTAPQGVSRYQVYRSARPDFEPSQANLIGTTREPSFTDVGLKEQVYYYRVVAVDNWKNRSESSQSLMVRIE